MAYTVLTLSELRKRLRARRDGILQWTVEEERLALNEALRTWNLLTGRWRRSAAQNTGIGTVEYTLPSTLLYGMRVTVNGTPLTITSEPELDLMRPNWRSETVASGGSVPTTPTLWAPVSLLTVAIWPAMNSVVANGFVAEGVSATPVLVEEGDTLDLGQEFLDDLLNFTLHLLAFKVGGQTWAATRGAFEAFMQAAAEENGVIKRNQLFRRWAGFDRRRDLRPTRGAATRLDDQGAPA